MAQPGFLVGSAAGFLVGRSTDEVSGASAADGATVRLVGVADPVVERAEDREPQLPRERLHHAIGGELRPDDRIDAGRQRIRRRRRRDRGIGGTGGSGGIGGTMKLERRNQSLAGRSAHAAAEQIIVERAGAQFADLRA